MREETGLNQERHGGSVDGLRLHRFIEPQLRKTELRRVYHDKEAPDRVGKLILAIEQDVIPRLVAARRQAVEARRAARDADAIEAAWVARFTRLLLGHETDVAPDAFVAGVRADGLSIERIYLSLLAPAARQVGTMWDEDLCTFVDVTLALGTLHRIMLALSADFRFERRKLDFARRVLLVAQSGDTHTFGLQMVAEFFKRGAWSVDMAASATEEALGQIVRDDWFTVVGFSISCEPNLPALTETILSVRRQSANPKIGILVGGPAFLGNPGDAARVGADGMAIDAIQAVLEAERFVLTTVDPSVLRSDA
jgi:methanogenic corrinoid protein MtbC1